MTVVRRLIARKQLPATQAVASGPWEIPTAALDSELIKRATQRVREGGRGARLRAADAATLKLAGVVPAEKY